jgi:hypothetical protein
VIVKVRSSSREREPANDAPGCRWRPWIAGLLFITPAGQAATEVAPSAFHLLRYDEDYTFQAWQDATARSGWEMLKYISLDQRSSEATHLSIGGETGLQNISKWDDKFGRIQCVEGSLQQRYMLHADLKSPKHFRIFCQLISVGEHGRKPAALPTDADHLDAQQYFAEVNVAPGAETGNYLRVGRQELLLAEETTNA